MRKSGERRSDVYYIDFDGMGPMEPVKALCELGRTVGEKQPLKTGSIYSLSLKTGSIYSLSLKTGSIYSLSLKTGILVQ